MFCLKPAHHTVEMSRVETKLTGKRPVFKRSSEGNLAPSGAFERWPLFSNTGATAGVLG